MLKKFKFLLDINNRVYAHLLFWLVYYIYRVVLYISLYDYTFLVQLLELPAKVLVVYLNLYILMPYLLRRQKLVYYGLSIILIIFLGAVLQNQIIKWMIKYQIYEMKENFFFLALYPYKIIHFENAGTWAVNYFLYGPIKFTATTSHFVELVVITAFIKSIKDAYLSQQKQQVLEKNNLENELKFLKTQINPHFFFNTLNNLYSLILLKSDKAPEVVLKLADLMHYMLYETNQNEVNLATEVNYLQNYIALEKLRFGDELTLDFKIEGELSKHTIAPMLLLALVENSFKHSKTLPNKPFLINILLKIDEIGLLNFKISNPLLSSEIDKNKEDNQGIGLKNTQRRLELIYPQKHQLSIQHKANVFEVSLDLRLNS